MQNREVSLVSFAAAILDMDGEVLSETWYTTEYDAELACADARRTGTVPPGGWTDIQVWSNTYRLDLAGSWSLIRVERKG